MASAALAEGLTSIAYSSFDDSATGAQALGDLNLDGTSFDSPPSSPEARRRTWRDGKGIGKQAEKGRQSDGGTRGQLTLREQEKVGFSKRR
jgi:hypothetical protein